MPDTEHRTDSADAYLRHPHLHGDLLTFVAEDDVWTVPAAGGRAWRISADRVPVSRPRISPDGDRIAWTSSRDGCPEVYLAPAQGGASVRLTYWADKRTRVAGWTPDGEVLVISTAGGHSTRRGWAWAVPVDGGPARRLPYGPVGGVALGPGGAVLLQTPSMFEEAALWKRYRGGAVGRLWIDPLGSGEFTRIHAPIGGIDGNVECPMWVVGAPPAKRGGRIAFLSDHGGSGQLWSSRPDGSDLRCHTDHACYVRNAATDGTRIVYQCAGELWLLDELAPGAEPMRVDVRLGGPRTACTPYTVDASAALDDFGTDRAGRGPVLAVRGVVHWLDRPDAPVRTLSAQPGVRARLPRVLGDTGRVAWVTDADGVEALEIAPLSPAAGAPRGVPRGELRPYRIGGGRLGRVHELAASPDGRRLAVTTHDGRVLLVHVASGEITEVDRSDHGEATGPVFSPDSCWLAWSHPGAGGLRQLKLADTHKHTVVEATALRFCDYSPAFTSDGRHLAFLSERTFDPVYQMHAFDLAFITGTRPQLLTLAAATASPFGPQRSGGPGQPAARPTVVDPEGLVDRVDPFPVAAGDYEQLRAAEDGVLWIRRAPVAGLLGETGPAAPGLPAQDTLERWDFRSSCLVELRRGVDRYAVSGDGTRMVSTASGRMTVAPADRPGEETGVDLTRVRTVVDPVAEWTQAYTEDGRLIRDLYVRSDMSGRDWEGVLDRYRPLVARLGCYDDFVDLLWEVHGELGSSHAYVVPRATVEDPPERQGMLGADLVRDTDGTWRIERLLPGEQSVAQARSPLAAPGVDVREGDGLLSVGGVPVDPLRGPGPLLAGTAGRPVELGIRPASGGPHRSVVVVPLSTEGPLRYHAWVADRRDHVDRASGGRLGYLHVPDMQAEGWAQLHRGLRTEIAREGLVVDLRENRGGHTSELIMEILSRRIIGWKVARNGCAVSYPTAAPRGPVVVVTDEFTASDGDIATLAVQSLGIGPVLGTRTWGGVTGMDWNFSLVDGTGLVLPRHAFWFEGRPGWGAENHGVDPDVEVVCTPQDWAAGRDPQLDEAIRHALKQLDDQPAKSPPQPDW